MTQRRKRTWYLRAAKYISQVVAWGSFATDTGGTVRKVRLILQLEEPGKGRTPSLRDVELHLAPEDARLLGHRLINESAYVDDINEQSGDGRATAHLWAEGPTLTGAPDPTPRRTVRRVPKLHTYGTYYYTSTEHEEVQVVERTDDAVYVRPIGGDEVIEIPRTEHDLFTLAFDAKDWEVLPA